MGNCDDKIDSLKMRCYYMKRCNAVSGGAAMRNCDDEIAMIKLQ